MSAASSACCASWNPSSRFLEVERTVGLEQVDQRLLGVLGQLARGLFLAESADAQNVEHQRAVVGDHGAAALADDGGVRNLGLVADALHVIHQVVGVFLERVVDARFEIGLRAVVVDAEAPADVQIAQTGAGPPQLHVHAGGLDDRALDVPDVGDLAAEVEVQQLEAVGHVTGFQLIQGAQRLGSRQPELGAVAARGAPAPRSAAGQLEAHPDHGTHPDAARVIDDQAQLGEFFDDRDDLPANLVGQHHHLDVLVVLEAVADDGRLVVGDGQHGQQLGFGARLQPELERTAELEDLLDHLPLLVHLDRINAAVVPW